VYLIDIKKTVREYLADENCYSVIAVCKGCGGQRRGLLVPPLAMKFDMAPPLNPLIERAQEAFEGADVILAVGFSFAEADLYISRMLMKPLQLSDQSKVVVFDPDYAVVDKLRRQMSLRISGFDSKRILRVAGDCSETIPAFLSGRLKSLVKRPSVERASSEPVTKKKGPEHPTKASSRRPKRGRG
jgi:thiamine pyrophosphate-dependent acetolactate synthase large subunit-like protein